MTLLVAAVGLVGAQVAFLFERAEATSLLDGQLRQIALNAGTGVRLQGTPPPADDQDPEDQFSVTIWDAGGHVLRQSEPDPGIPRQTAAGYADVDAGGGRWRVYTTGATLPVVQVAQRETVREEIAASAALSAALPILAVIPLTWLVIGWAISRSLKGLDALSREIATRGAGAAEPIPMAGIPVEVAPLVQSMNELIGRLHAAIAKQKQFLADAAHELRTPLTALQIQVDGLQGSGSPQTAAQAAGLAKVVRRAVSLVNQLLRLARLDALDPPIREEVEIVALVVESVADLIPAADIKNIDLGVTLAQPQNCIGSHAELRALFVNLLDNAVRYTEPGGKVDVSIRGNGGTAVVSILDTGSGLPEGSQARLFDRFYRAEPSKSEGTGLGLAIVRRIAERHGFTIVVCNRDDGVRGVAAHITIPISTTA